jgi:hypothetical protein
MLTGNSKHWKQSRSQKPVRQPARRHLDPQIRADQKPEMRNPHWVSRFLCEYASYEGCRGWPLLSRFLCY